MQRLVADTNTIISGLLWNGAPRQIIDSARVMFFSSPAHPIPPTCRDPDDDAVLACALAADADFIVSGDKDLLTLGHFQHIPIVTAAQALARLHA